MGRILSNGAISERVEWFNVTYRSVVTLLLVALVLGLGAGSYWFYFHRYVPRDESPVGDQPRRDTDLGRRRAAGEYDD